MIVIFTDGAAKGNPGPGGYGAVREICDLLLKAGGHWEQVTARYFSEDQ